MSIDFETFMKEREAAARAYVSGDPRPVVALSTLDGQATFFDPGGGFTEGSEAVNRVNIEGAKQFGPTGTTRFEIADMTASGELAFWTGFQHAEIAIAGQSDTQSMKLRITEVFKRDDGEWRMVHRHASPARTEG